MAGDHPLKSEGLDVGEAASGFVINDTGRGRVHYLNHTAALIFELCDGGSSVEEISELVRQAYDLPDRPDDVVRTYLDRLIAENLVA